MYHSEFVKVSARKPCAVCGKPDWCTRNTLFHACMRIHDAPGRFKGAKNGASLYRIDGAIAWEPPPVPIGAPSLPVEHKDMGPLAGIYKRSCNGHVESAAKSLGVSASALERLGMGWDGEALTFPMFDENRRVIGIRRRFDDGRKLSIKGGHEGVFLPDGFPERDEVLICEGPTDTAAALSLGFEALGRPSCRGAVDITATLCARVRCVIVADADKPGQDGAAALKERLDGAKIVTPKAKDMRKWVAAGATHEDVAILIKSAR